ncbi:N-acetylmuramoyl-L-alanine amidase [Schaalia sp. JY-X169]|uniref:N-acetylmuramoyl-L-alanine amidase n=1 Tax=Schaalia sp. JY-X169 TaxID=2758572 RepID=UPI0015F384F8|nr:N-acetylmuramoyl-L-alanine amidase [Schaalia sp. JY-X169]
MSVEPTVSEVGFVEAAVESGYTDGEAVPEEVGDLQQVEAVAPGSVEQLDADVDAQARRALEGEVDVNIVRTDLKTDNALIAVTWDPQATDPELVSLRYLLDGTWSEWVSLEVAEEPGDETEGAATVAGTEPFSLFFADAVEVVARGTDDVSIPGLTLVVIDAESTEPLENNLAELAEEASDEDAVEETAVEETVPDQEEPVEGNPQSETSVGDELLELEGAVEGTGASFRSASTSVLSSSVGGVIPAALNSAGTVFDTGYAGLKINTRKAWGANESLMTWTPKANKIQGAVIHHTESSNNYTQAQVAQQIRNIYEYHAVELKWGDIGYNVIVDQFGGVWEGRAGGLTNQIHAAHAGNANGTTFGITVMGGFMDVAPIAAAQDSVAKTIAWKLQLHGINSVDGKISVLHQSGKYVSVPVVSAHRDVGWTDCPGDAFYTRMPSVRTAVQKYLTESMIVTPTPNPPTAPTTSFDAANVISDSRFYDSNAMSEAQIKNFIQTTGKDCKPGSGTTCLKDTVFPTQNLKTLRGGCAALSMSGNQSPWTIIDKTAKACGLSPEVILVTLQKEQSGLTQPRSAASWAKAMGSGCPDGSGCDAAQGGFQKQIYYGADKLVSYKIQSQAGHVDAFKSGKAMTVLQNPGTACGSSSLKFANVATASLYEYTPYIGNAGKAGCSTIGQKMFWDLMNRYFPASTTTPVTPPTTPPVTPPVVTQPKPAVSWQKTVQIGRGWPTKSIFPGDWDKNGQPDMMLINAKGDLILYRGLPGERFQSPVKIGQGWNVMDWVQGGVDWNGDGNMDLLARVKSTGELYMYPGNGRGGFNGKVRIGVKWQNLKNLVVTQTAKGPGIYAISGDQMLYYPGNGRGGFNAKRALGFGWKNMTALIPAGDWTGDKIPDLLVRDSKGLLFLYSGTAAGTPGTRAQVGTGWNVMRTIGPANATKSKSALWAVRNDGALMSYKIH